MTNLIVIDGSVEEVTRINGNTIEIGNRSYILFEDQKEAGEAAREYWFDMAHNDKEEFKCMVGTDCLVNWCLGEWDGTGAAKVQSLDEWFDLHLDIPEEHFASYDGEEIEGVQMNFHLANELDFEDCDKNNIVMYRQN